MDALRVENLCKRYSGDFALENVSFSLAEGSIMGLIGANGAGKTTTLKALMGYLRPDAGTVTLFGQPFPPENTVLRQRTGFVSGGVDYFPRKRLSAITAATRPFMRIGMRRPIRTACAPLNWTSASGRRSCPPA